MKSILSPLWAIGGRPLNDTLRDAVADDRSDDGPVSTLHANASPAAAIIHRARPVFIFT